MSTADIPASEQADVLELDWFKERDRIMVTPKNRDRFMIRVRKAISLLQLAAHQQLFEQQLDLLLSEVGAWISGRNDVRSVYVTLRDGALALVAVQDRMEYDPALEDALSELDIKIAKDNDFDLIKLHTLAVPPVSDEALQQFLDPSFTLRYNRAEGSRPHSSGQQVS